jgi:hypothetical protein
MATATPINPNSRISTDIGFLNLKSWSTTYKPLADGALRGVNRSSYGISTDRAWIVKDGRSMFWLPAEFRPAVSAVVGSTIAIGCPGGRVLVIKFSSEYIVHSLP